MEQEKEAFLTVPFVSLETLFDTPIKSKDRYLFDSLVFGNLRNLLFLSVELDNTEDIDNILENNNYLAWSYFIAKNNSSVDTHEMIHIEESLKKNDKDLKELTINGKKAYLIKMTIVDLRSSVIRKFKDIPKSGFFCTRSVIAGDWYRDFINYTREKSDELGIDFSAALIQHVWRYLVAYHGDIFVKRLDESDNDTGYRVLMELNEEVERRLGR